MGVLGQPWRIHIDGCGGNGGMKYGRTLVRSAAPGSNLEEKERAPGFSDAVTVMRAEFITA